MFLRFKSNFKPKFKKTAPCFTLSEVLITLVVIGVIAAITVPIMINNYIEQATVQKVKKFHSTMNQALLMAIKDNGMVNTWDYEGNYQQGADKLMKYFKPYLRIMKDCGVENCNIVGKSLKYLNGSSLGNGYSGSTYYKLIFDDGSAIWMRINGPNMEPCSASDGAIPNVCAVFWYDTNADKNPNTLGKDIFAFHLLKNSFTSDRWEDSCTYSSQGWNCAEYILTHGDMKYPK